MTLTWFFFSLMKRVEEKKFQLSLSLFSSWWVIFVLSNIHIFFLYDKHHRTITRVMNMDVSNYSLYEFACMPEWFRIYFRRMIIHLGNDVWLCLVVFFLLQCGFILINEKKLLSIERWDQYGNFESSELTCNRLVWIAWFSHRRRRDIFVCSSELIIVFFNVVDEKRVESRSTYLFSCSFFSYWQERELFSDWPLETRREGERKAK